MNRFFRNVHYPERKLQRHLGRFHWSRRST